MFAMYALTFVIAIYAGKNLRPRGILFTTVSASCLLGLVYHQLPGASGHYLADGLLFVYAYALPTSLFLITLWSTALYRNLRNRSKSKEGTE